MMRAPPKGSGTVKRSIYWKNCKQKMVLPTLSMSLVCELYNDCLQTGLFNFTVEQLIYFVPRIN